MQRPKDTQMATNYWLGSLVMFPLAPYALYFSLKPNYDSMFYAILYNAATKQGKLVKYEFMKREITPEVLNLHIYDLFLQLHHQ